ncbi:hypothetical protein ACH5RR_030389 [Cinchona calisaya]|uniref:18S pre-ribosomal assembly protein gar2-related n=1 Tax=Cinchona calisaya TaxID=153742 RepID=A0ABD2YUI6_9GENT
MKENQREILCHSNGFDKEADPLACPMKNGHDSLNASVHKCSQIVDRRTDSDDDQARDSGMVCDQEGPLYHSNYMDRDLEPTDHKNEFCNSPKFGRSIIVDDFVDRVDKETGDSETVCTTGSPLSISESDAHFYTDKSVRDCELSEVIICYRESNYQIVKDICVDEGLPTQDKTVIEADKDDHAGLFFSQPCGEDKHSGTTNACHDIESSLDGLEAYTVEDIANSVLNERGTREEVDIATFFLDGSKSSEDYAGKDATKALGPEKLTQMGAGNWSITERTADDVSEDESAISRGRNSQESIVQDSILLSSDCGGNEAPKQLDEVPSVEAILETLSVAFTKDDSKKNGTPNNLHYNSKVESGTFTFDFKSPKPAVDSDMDGNAEFSHEGSLKSDGVAHHKHGNLNDHSAATMAECERGTSMNEPKTQLQDAVDHPGQFQRGVGESSFSSPGHVSGVITYSGPIAYSGSLSLRSDSSTTSNRSFAFPVLQSEWNSSPVRMAKADRRHLRKHKGWIQGLFCCRF